MDGITHIDTPTVFKRLVIVTTGLYLLWVALPWIQDKSVSQEISDALSWYGFGAVLPLPTGIALLYVPVAFGLCNFSAAARWLFVALTAFGYAWSLLGGLRVETALGATLGGIVTLGD